MKIKLLTLNIWHGGRRFDEVVDFIKMTDADIVMLQEVRSSEYPGVERRQRTLQEYRKLGIYPYDDFAPMNKELTETGGKGYTGIAVFSKFPIKTSQSHFIASEYSETYRDVPGQYQNSPRVLQEVIIDFDGLDFNVFNLHGPWNLDGDEYSGERQEMERIIRDETLDKQRVIVAGDSNAKVSNRAIWQLTHLNSVFDIPPTSTFNMRQKDNPGYATSVVDIMMVSPDMNVLSSECPDVNVSDHLPIIAELEYQRSDRLTK